MAFTSFESLKEAAASMLKKRTGNEIQTSWDIIIARSLTAAYNEIVRRLAKRGFSLAQIATFDGGAEFETDIGLYWTFVKGGGLSAADDKWINKLDRREELDTVFVTASGVALTPASTTGIAYGTLDTTQDLFSFDPDDSRIGEPTEW